MNYARIRNKLKENQKKLNSMAGEDRTKLEKALIDEAINEKEASKEDQKEEDSEIEQPKKKNKKA